MPLGQLLIEEGVITRGQLAAALQRQAQAGGRLGTNLIELRWASIDQIARGLAQLHSVPAALERHLEGRDPALARAISRELAAKVVAVPIRAARTGGLVVCMRDPTSREVIAALTAASRRDIVPCVAAELAIHRCLASAYSVPMPPRFAGQVDVDLDSTPSARGDFAFADRLQLVQLDDRDVERDDSQRGIDQRQLSSLLDAGPTVSSAHPITRDAGPTVSAAHPITRDAGPTISNAHPITRDAGPTVSAAHPITRDAAASRSLSIRAMPPEGEAFIPAQELAVAVRTFTEATAALATVAQKDEVGDTIMGYVRGAFTAGVMLVIKDAMALGLRGFGGAFTSDTVESIVVPLAAPSLFKSTWESMQPFIGVPPVEHEGNVVERFFKLFPPATGAREIALVPVTVRDRVVCLVYAHGHKASGPFEAAAADLVALARTSGEAYLRLLRAAKQK